MSDKELGHSRNVGSHHKKATLCKICPLPPLLAANQNIQCKASSKRLTGKTLATASVLGSGFIRLAVETVHFLTHTACEHITFLCLMDKATALTGVQEQPVIEAVSNHFVFIIAFLVTGYIGWQLVFARDQRIVQKDGGNNK